MGLRRTLLLTAIVFALATPPAGGGPPQREQLPNLVPLPPFDVEIGAPDGAGGPAVGALRFATAVANRGDFAFDLMGTPEDPVGQTSKANQCMSWATDRVCTARREVGRFVWHPEHGHHHFEDFAQYELRHLKRSGRPDMKRGGLVAGGTKVSFCLMDIESDEGEAGSGGGFPFGHPLYMSCLAGSGFQGISAGWRDVYSNGLAGQQILLDGVPDGTYALLVRTDPSKMLLETSKRDNVAVTGVTISEGGTKVEVVCRSELGDTRCRSGASR